MIEDLPGFARSSHFLLMVLPTIVAYDSITKKFSIKAIGLKSVRCWSAPQHYSALEWVELTGLQSLSTRQSCGGTARVKQCFYRNAQYRVLVPHAGWGKSRVLRVHSECIVLQSLIIRFLGKKELCDAKHNMNAFLT